jgi:hypothetical protein
VLSIGRSLATIAVVLLWAPLVLAIIPVKHPDYCPLPENVTFDRTQHPEIIGLYTGTWVPIAGPFYVRKFCFLLTSVRGNEVRGIYSWETGGWDGPSGWRELQTAGSGPLSTIRFSDWRGADEFTIRLEFPKNGKAAATYTRSGKGLFGRQIRTVLESRLVKLE